MKKRGLDHILAAAACLVAASGSSPALAQQVVASCVVSVVNLLDDRFCAYTLRPILFLVPKGDTALLEARRRDADALRARFSDCESGLADARAQHDVVIREPITKNSIDLAPFVRDILSKTGLGHLTPPEMTSLGVELFAVCGVQTRPIASLPEPLRHPRGQSIVGPIPNVWQQIRPVVLVMPDFAASDPQLRQTAADMARFIGSVLQRSCHYKLINNDDIGDKAPGIDDVQPDFSHWRSIRSDIVVAGLLTELSGGQFGVEVRMWDVWRAFPRASIDAGQFVAPPDKVQHLSYTVAADMYERLCGDDGYTRMPN
jgi:hypothetical protein